MQHVRTTAPQPLPRFTLSSFLVSEDPAEAEFFGTNPSSNHQVDTGSTRSYDSLEPDLLRGECQRFSFRARCDFIYMPGKALQWDETGDTYMMLDYTLNTILMATVLHG